MDRRTDRHADITAISISRVSVLMRDKNDQRDRSMIRPVLSQYHEGSPVGKRSLRDEGFVEKVGFEPGVKE